jgi:hypothetical protein
LSIIWRLGSGFLIDNDLVFSIGLDKINLDELSRRDISFVSGVIGPDWKLPTRPIHKDGQSNRFWTSQINKSVHGGACGAACVEDVINEKNNFVVHIKTNFGSTDLWLGGALRGIQVVTVEGDVEGSTGNLPGHPMGQAAGKSLGENLAPASNANYGNIHVRGGVGNNARGQIAENLFDLLGVENHFHFWAQPLETGQNVECEYINNVRIKQDFLLDFCIKCVFNSENGPVGEKAQIICLKKKGSCGIIRARIQGQRTIIRRAAAY